MQTSPVSLVLAALVALPMSIFDGCTPQDESVALGVTSRERVALTATAAEIVVDLPVPEGSPVTRGTVLVRLDDSLQRANVALAAAETTRAEANLEKLRAGPRSEEIAAARADVAGAQANLKQAQTTYDRNLALLETDTVAEARLDVNIAQRDQARAALDHARETLRELESGTRPEDLAMARAEVAAARARLAAQQHQLSNLLIVASRDGWLDSLPWNLGERVSLGSPVAVLLASDTMLARVYVPEPRRVDLKEGDPIKVHVDGIDTPFDGRVSWISSEPAFTPYYALNQTERARLMYLAEIALPPEAADLPVGVPAQAILP